MVKKTVGFDILFGSESEKVLYASEKQKLGLLESFWLLLAMGEELDLLLELVNFVFFDEVNVLVDGFSEFLFVDYGCGLWFHWCKNLINWLINFLKFKDL